MVTRASAPAARNASAARRTASSSSGITTCPSASIRSGTSRRRSRAISGSNVPLSPYGVGRVRRPSSSTSRKPRVVISPAVAPLRSSSAFVAVVVSCTSTLIAGAMPALAQRGHHAVRLVAHGRRHLRDADRARGFVHEDEVGEGATDVDADQIRCGHDSSNLLSGSWTASDRNRCSSPAGVKRGCRAPSGRAAASGRRSR